MSTIYDVAKLAGVSAKTVSRVVNEDRAVKQDTRDRVLKALVSLDYRPNPQARQLRLGARAAVGLLVEDPTSGYQGRFHSAMLSACMESSKYLSVELFDAGADWMRSLDRFLADSGVRDMILLPTLCDFEPLKAFLAQRGVSCVLISASQPDTRFAAISMDDRAAASDVVRHLAQLGYRRIAHIAGHPDHAASHLRRLGYLEGCRDAGLDPVPEAYIVPGNFSFRSGFAAAERLLCLAERPTALFASNDEMAAGACSVAHKMGLRIPEDIAVIGFDDAPISSTIWPSLSTVRQPYLEMARRSIAILNGEGDVKAGDTGNRHVLAHEIVVRETTGARQDA